MQLCGWREREENIGGRVVLEIQKEENPKESFDTTLTNMVEIQHQVRGKTKGGRTIG